MATAAPAYAVSSHATTFTFAGTSYHCTDIQVENTSDEPAAAAETKIDISTLDLAHGSGRVFVLSPLTEPDDASATNKTTVSITFWGDHIPTAGVTADIVTTGVTGKFKCTKSTITRKVGAYVEGQATFTLAPVATNSIPAAGGTPAGTP